MFVLGLNRALKIIQTSKKHDKVVGIIASFFHLGIKTPANSFDKTIFDNPQVDKYLNYITNENSKHKSLSNKEFTALLHQKLELERELVNLKSMSSEGDEELKKLIESEKKQYLDNIEKVKADLLSCLLSENENDNRNVELRIISGVGGEEAKLFRTELFQMYINYAAYKNWECMDDLGSGYLMISGESAYGHLKHEGGVHRVQRVPETEKQNRVHTSTCSVVILPQPKPHEIVINEKDLIIERLRSSGPGGQHVNKTESCVRIKHIPSGIVIENQTSRFQYENKKIAIQRLRSTLFNIEQENIKNERNKLIKGQAGTNDYADKIRTYNFPQNRITDHRLNYSTHNMKGFLSGAKDLDSMIAKLMEFQRKKDFLDQIEITLQSNEYKNFEKNQMN